MPPDAASSGSPRSKPSTRSSIRQSLGLASMGKAFADVINKEHRDPDKSAKKAKDTSSRRLSALNLKPAAPRSSMGDTKPPPQTSKRVATPDSKTITRRRMSAAANKLLSDEQPSKPVESPTPPSVGLTRASSLRPRVPAVSSGLPKYRPKSALMETKQPPSPVRAGTRRRFSSSDDEKQENRDQKNAQYNHSPSSKVSRPISPLPQRVALKVNITNTTPTTTPSKLKPSTPSSAKASPARPTKTVKTANSLSAVQSAIPRPPSVSSVRPSTPRTPQTPHVRGVGGVWKSGQDGAPRGTPSRTESPLARHARKGSQSSTPSASSSSVGNMSHISEGISEDDSEADDVELLLAPVAALGAPTPAMPRIQTSRNRQRLLPQTPTRSNLLPTRANMSYLSPLPPAGDSPPSLRPPRDPGSDRAPRGSILSWEQLATEASRTLGEDEIENMLSDIPAPFRSGAVSPTPSTLQMDVPESPCLSAMSSPGGYGSISQVLLPDVTPSPAVHHHSQRYHMSSEVPAVDAAIVTLLRLQLASAENTGKERLMQMQAMEEEIHHLKEARVREAQELTKQVAHMEEQMRGTMEAKERSDEDRAAYAASLEDQLRHVQAFRDQAVDEAVLRAQEFERVSREAALKSQRLTWQVVCSARVAGSEWATVRGLAEVELDLVKGDREVLAVLLGELDQLTRLVSRDS